MNPKHPIKKPSKHAPTAYHQQPLDESTAGQLFRVRDKDWDAVYGENLTWADAQKLKEAVVTRGKSRTARLENMDVPPPDWYESPTPTAADRPVVAARNSPAPDPQRDALRRKALATSAQTAREANARRDRSSPAAAARTARIAPMPPVPVVSTIDPEDVDPDDPNIDTGDISELMAHGGDQPSEVDLTRAKADRDREDAEITAKASGLYEAHVPAPRTSWDKLDKKVRAHWRFEAINNPDQPPVLMDEVANDADANGEADHAS
jgi:hypothetical protein